MTASDDMGGTPAGSVAEVGGRSDADCAMAMNVELAESAILGNADQAGRVAAGGAIDLTVTTEPRQPCEFEVALQVGEIRLRDSSGSGGFRESQAGALMIMGSTGMQIIRSAWSKCPQGVNFARTRVTEEIVVAELHREGVQ